MYVFLNLSVLFHSERSFVSPAPGVFKSFFTQLSSDLLLCGGMEGESLVKAPRSYRVLGLASPVKLGSLSLTTMACI